MSDDGAVYISNVSHTVPLEPPPAYEPKPADDVDAERPDIANGHSTAKSLPLKKLLLSLSLAIISLWFTFVVFRAFSAPRSGVIYSSSYSKDHRFRPAASPVITESLPDGRTRIRGALPTLR